MNVGLNARFLRAPVTGVQRFGHELLHHLPAHARLTLFVPAGTARPSGFDGDFVEGISRGHVWEQLELASHVRRSDCQVMIHPSNTLPLAAHCSVVIVHDPLVPLSNPEWFSRRYVAWQRHVILRAIRRATRVLTVSEWSRVHLARQLGVSSRDVGVVSQGMAPFDQPAPSDEVRRVRLQYKLPDRYLLAFGGRDPRKNIRFMESVLDALARRGQKQQLIVIGDAMNRVHRPDSNVIERADIRLLGHLGASDTHALLTGASVLCFPSLCESFGRPPLEALCCGTPAVVAPYPAASEVLTPADWIRPLEPDLWAVAISQLLTNPDSRSKALRAGASLRVRFTWSTATSAVMQACREAVSLC
jgi:glycosyltransferase involved in cell wall biosynthesis